ncbi:MAG: DUF420 domain-containing protein [Blastocatellia bacterium]|nr:DUF420 domain-containing protein [Blastocatellia bacterium]MCS7157690.1 DUF420 domain-containing protein [Blastocatellia bacterium]MCX7751955.1 DUF420 domain-containing protein [Blastocatellia bacterium]MDW8167061.1 DUF420 domain-containing protein [Acidobacteriota bacterium]MDW8257165.1 DUF420 domain-containing protein [Acidobacteriota bacterium]
MLWPTVNAGLNLASALLLLAGYRFIRRREVNAHRMCMLAAITSSVLFLLSYVAYHSLHGTTPFPKGGAIRIVYFTILISHTVLALAILPMVLVTLLRALRGEYVRHRQIARWTLPLWLYVSVTGVAIYVMLYHL